MLRDPVGENPPIATVIVCATSLMTVALMQVQCTLMCARRVFNKTLGNKYSLLIQENS